MRSKWIFVGLLALLLSLSLVSSPAQAASPSCTASPASGLPGTLFTFNCSGFSPNTILNVYAVEPDGRAISGANMTGFGSGMGGGSFKTNALGNGAFVFQSMGGGDAGFAHAIGPWTWVIKQIAPDSNGTTLAAVQLTINITSKASTQSGALLTLVKMVNGVAWFSGTGFFPNEAVNVWVTPPGYCSGRLNVEGVSAEEPFFQGFFDGMSGPNTVKTNERGEIFFPILFTSLTCDGYYTVTVSALGSGRGDMETFWVSGSAVPLSATATLTANPKAVSAISPFLTLSGTGFMANAQVNCWTTRPDGRTFEILTPAMTDASGAFSLAIHASDMDSFAPFASEEPGTWYATCRVPGTATAAQATFMVLGLLTP